MDHKQQHTDQFPNSAKPQMLEKNKRRLEKEKADKLYRKNRKNKRHKPDNWARNEGKFEKSENGPTCDPEATEASQVASEALETTATTSAPQVSSNVSAKCGDEQLFFIDTAGSKQNLELP